MPKIYEQQLKVIFPDGKPLIDRADAPDNAYHGGTITDVAIAKLSGYADSGESFFLAVGYKKPHLPFNAPGKYWAIYDRESLPTAEVTATPEGAPDFAPQPD